MASPAKGSGSPPADTNTVTTCKQQVNKSQAGEESKICAQCGNKIQSQYLLRALDQFWHEDCLKCSYCSSRLCEMGAKFYFRGDLILCKRDYIRIFGATGICSFCFKTIPPLEMVMRARQHVYHLDCFACQVCRHRFCVGDKFYLHHNTVLCEDDYDDLMMCMHQMPGAYPMPAYAN